MWLEKQTHTHIYLWTKLVVLRVAASSSRWAEALSFSFEAPESGSRLLSVALTAKPSQEKQVGGLIPFANNRKRQPFLSETRACWKQTNTGCAVPLVLKKGLFLRKSELQKLPVSLVEISLP